MGDDLKSQEVMSVQREFVHTYLRLSGDGRSRQCVRDAPTLPRVTMPLCPPESDASLGVRTAEAT
ncbi:hypothetical protein HNQ08_000518 [Deinococcus humi]|uniref:Uncharacterized protein n=1 Tax=Deinococcus humi TaxID=662880 RepID=A0A7W8JQQ9_9DEIO|nr:hypothetical protein [Deinococcus humi]